MIFVVLHEAAKKGNLLLVDGGLCHFHRDKRDNTIIIHEMLVLPSARRGGVGRGMIEKLQERYPGSSIRCKCPFSYLTGNAFWEGMGFELLGREIDPKIDGGGFNLWELHLDRPS